MPELAEVFYNASRWKPSQGESFRLAWLHGGTRCCRFLKSGEIESRFSEVTLLSGYTHGKRMLFAFSGGVYLEAHLGMTGSLHRFDPGYDEAKYDHFALKSDQTVLVFRDPRQFGKLKLHDSEPDRLPEWWSDLPPEPHAEAFTREHFDEILSSRKGSVLKALLLKQELFPGVGNWMADEILWRAKIRPDRRLSSLNKKERGALFSESKWVCREALRIIGKDYSDPPASWLFLHRWKDGGICPVSKKPLRRDSIGGRTTCWSPAVQK